VDATPRCIFKDFAFVFGRKLCEITGVVGQLDGLVVLQEAERVGKSHFAVLMMMTIRLAIRGHVDQLRLGGVFEAGSEARREVLTGVQEAFKRGQRARPGRCKRRTAIERPDSKRTK